MIVLGDLSPLFEIDLTGYALAATADYMPTNDQHRQQLNLEFDERTFCSGIMMVNLKYWREHNSEKDLLNFAKKTRNPVYLHDQDVLNSVFRKQWFRLPPKWNRIVFNIVPGGPKFGYKRSDICEYLHSPMIVHYANKVKPWYDMWMPMRYYYREYLKKSGYKNVKFQKICLMQRLGLYYVILRYLYKYYVLPLTPQLLFIMIQDIHKLVAIFLCPTKLRDKFYYKQMEQ
jgi:lipopolysaccharide biosynthesis glycosyltransferase